MNNITFNISYAQAFILTHTLTYYTSGPKFQCVKKSLSRNEQDILNSFDDRIEFYKEETKKKYPELFGTPLYKDNKAWNIPVVVESTTVELDLAIQAIEESINETESDDFYELEVIAGHPIADIRRCLELLMMLKEHFSTKPQ